MRARSQLVAGLFLPLTLVALDAGATDPYEKLREAYSQSDAAKASLAYDQAAIYTEHYKGAAPVMRIGRKAIENGFAKLYEQLGKATPTNPVDLNFRLLSSEPLLSDRSGAGKSSADVGYYRLTVGAGSAQQRYFGSFSTVIRDGVFVHDTSGDGDVDAFENASGPVMFANASEVLDAAYYDRFLGRYADDRCSITITRSQRRLFALDECTLEWRGLNRVSGRVHAAGKTVLDERASVNGANVDRVAFDPVKGELQRPTNGAPKTFKRQVDFKVETITFSGSPKLAGHLYLPSANVPPNSSKQRAAVVLVHGSGPQDRHGYASIIELMAQRFARMGVVVLTYDKRGVRDSEGDWSNASFDDLANDAQAAMQFLSKRNDVDTSRVALAGSSQAGWVIAKAIERGANPKAIFLLGAAGAAMTVEEQNLYNTRVRMECLKLSQTQVSLALAQQSAFFAAKRDSRKGDALTAASDQAARAKVPNEWLFPSSVSRSLTPQWYDVLEPQFDPLPVWRTYKGHSSFIFAEFDDSTPTDLAIKRLKSVDQANVVVLRGAQHLGLAASALCDSGIETRTRFHKEMFGHLDRFAEVLSR